MLPINIQKIIKKDYRLEINLSIPKELKHLFAEDIFFVEYNRNIEQIPDSIAVIPLLAQLLPVSWIADFIICVDSLDLDFYNSIPKFKQGYVNMYSMLNFKGGLIVKNLEENNKRINSNDSVGSFFSGGLDAYATLIAHVDEHPILMFVQGADVKLSNPTEWEKLKKEYSLVANEFNTKIQYISSNFTGLLNHYVLNGKVRQSNDNWWHGFQHGLGLIGLAAPLAWSLGMKKIYIASSHTSTDHVSCASDPSIDNYVRFCGCKIHHDQYEFNRFEKTRNVCQYIDSHAVKINLRVCFYDQSGKNCCKCEKCLRTATAITILGGDSSRYGLDRKNILRGSKVKVLTSVSPTAVPLWEDMQREILKNESLGIQCPQHLGWLKTCDFLKECNSFKIRGIRYLKRKSTFVKRIIDNL